MDGETFADIRGDDFWGDLYISHLSKAPLDHMMAWLHKSDTSGRPPCSPCHYIRLRKSERDQPRVRCASFRNAYNLAWAELLDVLEDRSRDEFWIARGVQTTLEIAADYKRRILLPARQYPLSLKWLVYSPSVVDCPYRRSRAADLMDALSFTVNDQSTLKLRNISAKSYSKRGRVEL